MSVHIFIPSYHRPRNIKTAKLFKRLGYDMQYVTVFIDSEADDREEYEKECEELGCNLHVFDMEEARRRYDYVHRAPKSRRSAGQARNMMYDYAREHGIDFYMVSDDDSDHYQVRVLGRKNYRCVATLQHIEYMMQETEKLMRTRKIGCFAWSQTGDLMNPVLKIYFRKKVMNTTFYLLPYVYRGERGVQDDDTSQFTGMMNRGMFTGSYGCGVVLKQMLSATQEGGLTDLYNECKLLNKSLVTVIQYPSAIKACRQEMNGGRLHHLINYRYLMPKILKGDGSVDNIAWDTYPEDFPFTNEPKRRHVETKDTTRQEGRKNTLKT